MIHGGDVVARQLAAEDVDVLFTLTGGHISPIYDGTRKLGIRLIDMRHEQAVAHAADALARLRRRPAAAAVTAGPGVTGALTGMANAYYSNSPVVLLGGRNPVSTDGAGNLQDAPQVELLRPVTKFAQTVHDGWRLPDVMAWAFAAAAAPRMGPSYVDLPMDVLLARHEDGAEPPVAVGRRATDLPAPDPAAVSWVAARLARAKSPVVLAGSGAYWARAEEEVEAFVRAGALPLYVNGMARGLLRPSHPNLCSQTRSHALARADVVVLLGCDFDFRIGFGQAGIVSDEADVIQVDPQADVVGRNRAVTRGIVSDVRAFLRELMKRDGEWGGAAGAWLAELRDLESAAQAERRKAIESDLVPIHPMRLVGEVAAFLDEDAVVIGDGGDIVAMTASVLRAGRPGHWMDPGPFGCLGIGAPFAIAARLARPGKQVLVMFGDGSFGFNGMEYDSAVRQRLPFVGVVGNDGAWGEMRTFHEDVFGPEHVEAQYLSQETRYDRLVEALGGFGQRVVEPSEIRPALRRAFDAGVPALIDVVLDPKYRRPARTISGRHVAAAFGGGDPHAFREGNR